VTTVDELRRDALSCHGAALAAVEPGRLVVAALGNSAVRATLVEGGQPVHLLAAGKAATAMARAALGRLGALVRRSLVVVPADGAADALPAVRVVTAGHPVPTADSVRAADAALELAAASGPDGSLVVLLSGGASALLAAPAAPLTLADKQAVTRRLLEGGADVTALNVVRKHCSRLKGGGLLRAARRAAAVWTFVLSDVLNDDLATIGSGPTVADPSTFEDALAVLDRLALGADVPPAVVRHLEAGRRGEFPETVKPGDPLLARSRSIVVGDNATALEAARRAAEALGYATTVLPPLTGDAAAEGRAIVERLRALPGSGAVALVAGAEPTVQVVPGGRGCRAQHLGLAAALALGDLRAVVLAAGTDGADGPTDAAGAVVDGGLVARGVAAGVDLRGALERTDSHPALDALGALVRTGPTGTNVSDLVVALRAAC
jgi:glycerate 2-kinase